MLNPCNEPTPRNGNGPSNAHHQSSCLLLAFTLGGIPVRLINRLACILLVPARVQIDQLAVKSSLEN